MRPANSESMTDSEWDRHQRVIAGFETAWKRGERPKIGAFLPDDNPRREELLVELVHADLEFRIKSGESARVEDYLRKYPSLARSRETVLELIKAECSIRRRREPGLGIDRYLHRFPEFEKQLEALKPEASTVTGTPPSSPSPSSSSIVMLMAKADPVPATPSELPLPRRFGKFELKQRLGVGTFGIVYRAWDPVMSREVAVKIPRPEVVAAQADLRAFLREARNAADLQHPHIVAVHEAGPIDGTDCLVRAYIEGATLADRLRQAQPSPEESAELMVVVAEAIDYAHGRKIIHRDLKPSNILIDLRGQPHVSDFGLAKREASDTTLSPAGQTSIMIGTPAYMSPEQSRGEANLVDARSDVYSLGVVLYEMLTGGVPFRGRGRMLQLQIEEAEPIPPRSLNDEVPLDLETICLKALAKDPDDRYQSARAMADDLRNFLGGRPVGAKPEPSSRSFSRIRSKKALVTLSVWSVLLIALVSTVLFGLRAEARRSRDAEGLERAYQSLLSLASPADAANPRKALVARAWQLAEQLAPTLQGDPALIEVVADARLGLAKRASLEGSDRIAGPRWREAIAAVDSSIHARSAPPSRLEDLAFAVTNLAQIKARAGEFEESRALFDRALGLWTEVRSIAEAAASEHHDNLEARLRLAEILLRLAEARKAAGDPSEILEVETIDVGLRESSWLVSDAIKRRIGRLMLDLSRWQLGVRQPWKAEASARTAQSLYRDASPKADDEPGLARAELAIARAHRDLGREVEAACEFRTVAQRFEALVSVDPDSPEDRRDLGVAFFEAGRLLDRRLSRDEAIDCYRQSLGVRLELDRDFPNGHAHLDSIAEVRAALAFAFRAEGRPVRAALSQSRAIWDQARAVALAPGSNSYRERLSELTKNLIRIIRGIRSAPHRSGI